MTTTTEEARRHAVIASSLAEIRRLRAELAATRQARTEPIAIIGMGCRMPGGANDPDTFWRFLAEGRDGVSDVPPDRWDAAYHRPDGGPGTISTRRGGFLTDIDKFDPHFFGVSPREAAFLDPQQRLLLEVGWEALEHGGQAPDRLRGTDTGVFVGVTNYDYCQEQMRQVSPADLEAYCLTSNASTYAAGRLSYWLGLTGPSMSVDTACSSALVAVHLAVQSLRAGECGMALAGGVNVLLAPEWFVVLSKARMLAPDGRCKTFDAAADGYVRSEGCGVVVLKRLSDAVAAGDRVLAVIRGSAVNQDGRSSGVTVPNGAAQREVIRQALRAGDVSAEDVTYLEAHGTGTPLGDPIELRAASEVLRPRAGADPLMVGSVKTNVGHLEPAAGIAGLIKVVLSLQHRQIPPHLHLRQVNPEIDLDELNVVVPTALTPWRGHGPLVAGVSSFGASGTNAHVVLAEPPPAALPAQAVAANGQRSSAMEGARSTVVPASGDIAQPEPQAEPAAPEPTAQLLVLSARTPEALRDLAGRYRDRLATAAPEDLPHLAYSAATGRAHFAYRAAVVGSSVEHVCTGLAAVADGARPPAGTRTGQAPAGRPDKVAFLFTGQGAQYADMARLLDETEPTFRHTLDRCDEILRPVLDRPLRAVLFPGPGDDPTLIDETQYSQPALFAVEYALAELWRAWGIHPDAVLGHSLGELVAACVAGVFGLEDGLWLAARRGQLMQELSAPGEMLAVLAEPERVAQLLRPYAADLSLAAVNGPENVVVSGVPAALRELREALHRDGMRTRTVGANRGFHSPLMEPVLAAFNKEASRIGYAEPRIPVISNVTGAALSGADAFSADYLCEHIRQPVRFHAGMQWLFAQDFRAFVEVGPAPTLSAMARRIAAAEQRPALFLPSLRQHHDDWRVLLDSAGALYTAGYPVDLAGVHHGRKRHRVDLPTYPFQRRSYWFRPSNRSVAEPAGERPGVPAIAAADPPASLLGRRRPSPLAAAQFDSTLRADLDPCLGDCVMDDLPIVNIGVYLAAALAAAAELYGPGPALVEDCTVLQSLVLSKGSARDVQLVVEPAAASGGTFRYYAAGEPGDAARPRTDDWVLHARGSVRPYVGEPPAVVPLDALRQRLTDEVEGAAFYRRMAERKLEIGPSARWIDHVWHTAGEALARMRPPMPGETARYLLHPGLTDAAFQLLFACLDPADTSAYLLVSVDRFQFTGPPPAEAIFCHAVLDTAGSTDSVLVADVRLLDATGRPIVVAERVCLKRADRAAVQHRSAVAVGHADAVPAAGGAAASVSTGPANRAAVLAAAPEVRTGLVRQVVLDAVATALGAAADEIDTAEPLQNLGLDSLMAIEVKEAVSATLGVAVPLVAFLDGRSVDALVGVVLDLLPGDAPEPAVPSVDAAVPRQRPAPPPEVVAPIVADTAALHEPFELTDLQQAYLVGRTDAFELGNVSTYFFVEVDLADVDEVRLVGAFQQMVQRHPMLRAVIIDDGRQRILPEVPPYEPTTVDLRACADDERARRLDAIHQQMRDLVFDPSVWPLFEVRLTRIDETWTRLHVGLDALIIDAWSTSLLFREWAAAYRGEGGQLRDVTVTFRDYVQAVRSQVDSPRRQRAWEYWRERLDSLPPAPQLPLAVNPAAVARPRFRHRSGQIPADVWQRFKAFAAAAGVTPSAALCAAYAQVLAAWSRSSHFTLNVLFFNRQPLHPDVPYVLGNFSATTLLEIHSAAAEPFADRAAAIQRQLWSDLEHSQVSGVEVLRELNRRQGAAARATMPVVFASTINFAAREDQPASAGLSQHLIGMARDGREVGTSIRTPQVWLDHQVVENAGEAVLNWDVVEELFPPGMVDAMFGAYLETVRELCEDEQSWRRPASVLVPEADLAARRRANATDGPLPRGLLHEGFLRQAADHPERVAVVDSEATLTYGQLDDVSNRLGRWLRDQGAGLGTLVGIVMRKGWPQVAAALGILKTGAAYVPIDADVPAERLRRLLDTAGISIVLTQSHVDEVTAWPPGVQRLAVDGPAVERLSGAPLPPPAAGPDDLAYVIFTSGSTGLPKGVMIEHSAALNTIRDVNERFTVTARDRVLGLSAMNFDLSVYDIFGMLDVGGALVLPEPAARREPARWANLIAEHGVTIWNSVPTLMEMFTEHCLAADPGAPRRSLPLRVVMMSGDWIPVTLPDRIRTLLPDAQIWSLGGATEASIWSIWYRIEKVDPAWASIPYGRPMRNQRFHVLDDELRPCPVWVPGQLYIGGVGLARGYLNDSAKTRASFLRHPATGERLYRTGDLGRYLPDGTIEFLGREDFQVKVQGYRIELGEIEAALLQIPDVRAAVVSALGERHGGKRLVAHVVPDAKATVTPDQITEELRRQLPDYLVPQHIVLLTELPLSANGKVDRSALPAPEQVETAAAPSAPRDELEADLVRLWEEFFPGHRVHPGTNFFDAGGDSLLAVRLMARIAARWGRSLPMATLFTRPTVGSLADALREAPGITRRASLVPIQPAGTAAPLFFVHPVSGDVLCYAELARRLGADQPFFGLQVPDGPPLETVPALAAHYMAEILAAAPAGPYRIGGWSMGGVVALEIAQQLTAAGHPVELLVLVDVLEPPGPANTAVDEAALLSWFARDLAGLAGREVPLPSQEGGWTLSHLHQWAVAESLLPADVGLRTLEAIFERFARNFRAMLAYQPRPYQGPVRFLRAVDGSATETVQAWRAALGASTEVVAVPGDHYTIMQPPLVGDLADALRKALSAPVPGQTPSTTEGEAR